MDESGGDITVRQQLSSLRSLLVLSELLTALQDEAQIVHIVASTVSSLGRCRTEGIVMDGLARQEVTSRTKLSAAVVVQLSGVHSSGGGPVELPGRPWAWGYPFSTRNGPIGYLVVSVESQPRAQETLLLEVLAQQAGAALANARLHTHERAQAEELRSANLTLERSTTIHQRLTKVCCRWRGPGGHRTGCPRAHRVPHSDRRSPRQPPGVGGARPACPVLQGLD